MCRAEKRSYVRRNQRYWDSLTGDEGAFAQQEDYGRRQWQSEPNWGDWSVPETELRLLTGDVGGLGAIELGCGTAYISAWLARAGRGDRA